MSNPEAPQPEATPDAIRDEVREQPRETQSPQDPSQRQFLKTLFGGAGAIAGLAVAGELLNPTPAEAAFIPGGAAPGTPAGFRGFPAPATTGDYVNTNLLVEGHLEVRGYRPWIDVTAHGAVGDWSENADDAVANAIAALPVGGGVIYFPPGVYAFNRPIVFNVNRNVTFMGAGRGVTWLYWSPYATDGGLHITVGNTGLKVTIRDLWFYTDAVSTTPAIRFTLSSGWSGGPTCSPHIHDIWITPGSAAGARWAKGIEMNDGSGAKIERFEIVCGPGATHGIHLRSLPLPTSKGSTIVNICSGALMMSTGAAGIEVSDTCEGTYIRGVEVVGGKVGYKLTSASPGSAISDCHAATDEHGIYIKNHGEMALTGNLLYGQGTGTWTGIHAEGTGPAGGNPSARRLRIMGNGITSILNASGNPDGPRNGIYLTGAAYDCTIQGNVLTHMDTGITLEAGTSKNLVLGNRISAAFPTADYGTGNLFVSNLL